MDSAKVRELDARYLASVLKVRFFPLVIDHAAGCRITDADGITRLDFTAGWAVANLGYNNTRVREAVADQFARTSFGTLTAMMSEQSAQLAERLAALVPGISRRRSGLACTAPTPMTVWPNSSRWRPAVGE